MKIGTNAYDMFFKSGLIVRTILRTKRCVPGKQCVDSSFFDSCSDNRIRQKYSKRRFRINDSFF